MNTAELEQTARALVAAGKGLLAADESGATIQKRFAAIGVESSEPSRRAYRELLFTAPSLGEFISGAILYDETLRQSSAAGVPFAVLLDRAGIIPGIKVDAGTRPLPGFPGELVTEGLDGLAKRLVEYRALGARFAKWRAVIDIGAGVPSSTCIEANAELLARYAGLCQEAGLVPIVEPEVLMDGAHSLERCAEVSSQVLGQVFARLAAYRVQLEGIVLKPNMVLSGRQAPERAAPAAVAAATLAVLRRHVPPAVPGIAFLSGGQDEAEASLHLDLINRAGPQPWALTFSYGRALQHSALEAWRGQEAQVGRAQAALIRRARLNSLAAQGRYVPALEAAT